MRCIVIFAILSLGCLHARADAALKEMRAYNIAGIWSAECGSPTSERLEMEAGPNDRVFVTTVQGGIRSRVLLETLSVDGQEIVMTFRLAGNIDVRASYARTGEKIRLMEQTNVPGGPIVTNGRHVSGTISPVYVRCSASPPSQPAVAAAEVFVAPPVPSDPLIRALDEECHVISLERFESPGTPSGPTRSFRTIRLLALNEMGVINIAFQSPAFGSRDNSNWYTVQLRQPVNPSLVRIGSNGIPCHRVYDYSAAESATVREEKVKGGRTNWDGKIVYAKISKVSFEPKYAVAMKGTGILPNAPDVFQIRALFRRDVFSGDWRFIAFDRYDDKSGSFLSTRVVDNLSVD